ncbi:hypothetical protein UF36_18450, partial [Vibrio parahaemolyticus]
MRSADWEQAVKFFAPISKSDRVHANFIFRFQHLALSEHRAADIACVVLEQIYRWVDGEEIPPIVRRLWTLASGRYLPEVTGFSR